MWQNANAYPESLGLHLHVRPQLAQGEVPCFRHKVFVIKSHPAVKETVCHKKN